MKILILALFSIHFGMLSASLGSQLYSQGNLQFNQVLSETISLSGNGYTATYNSTNSYTVPAGKVWKIESVGFMTYSGNNTYSPRVFLIVNGVQVLSNTGGTSAYDRSGTLNGQALWFKQGDVISFGMSNNCATTCSQSANIVMSLIEFNIIP